MPNTAYLSSSSAAAGLHAECTRFYALEADTRRSQTDADDDRHEKGERAV